MATATKMSKREMAALIAEAEAAAAQAFADAIPTPMVVVTPKNMMDSLMGGDGGGLDETKPIYDVPEGVCGFGWVNLKPANSRLANYIRAMGKGRTDSYMGGLHIPLYTMSGVPSSQSMARNEAAARAYAKVLTEAGFDAIGMSRID